MINKITVRDITRVGICCESSGYMGGRAWVRLLCETTAPRNRNSRPLDYRYVSITLLA